MFGDDLALVRRHLPVTVLKLLQRRHGRIAVDGGATVARALGKRLCEVCGLDVAIVGVLDGAEQAIGLTERPDFLDLFRRQHLDVDTDRFGNAGIVHIFVPAVLGAGETNIGNLGEADIHAGFLLKLFIELHRIFVDLADRIAHVEQRQQASCVPCGA